MKHFITGLIIVLSFVSLGQMIEISRSLSTAHYRVSLIIGPIPKMLTAKEAKLAKEGEVIVGMDGMGMNAGPKNANAHLEVAIVSRSSGKQINTVMPSVVVTDASGKAIKLESLMQMYDVGKGMSDVHFGTNMLFSKGPHTVRVTIKGETVIFKKVSL
jgi:hypothetical protein